MAKTIGLNLDSTDVVEVLTPYTAAGAIPVSSGTHSINGSGALAMTLAAPVAGSRESGGDDGKKLHIVAGTAQAHTVTTPANKINGNKLTATFAAAVGNGIELVANNGVWMVRSSVGITLS
jgi:hypothetical protein